MNWLKRILQRWLEIEPRVTVNQTLHLNRGKHYLNGHVQYDREALLDQWTKCNGVATAIRLRD